MGRVIAVLSGKGGTGKTSICACLATALAQMDKQVLCIDMDVGLRNLDIALGLAEEPVLPFTEVSEGPAGFSHAFQHIIYPTLHFFTAPVRRPYEEIDQEAFEHMIRNAREVYDYVLLDAPAGVGIGFQLAARCANTEILVTGPEPSAIRDGALCGDLLDRMGKQDVKLIVNRVSRRLYKTIGRTVDDVIDSVGFRLLGMVPDDPNVTRAAVKGDPLLMYNSRAAQAIDRIAHRLDGDCVPLARFLR